MSYKVILFVGSVMLLLLLGMWRYAVLWQAEQQIIAPPAIEQTENPIN